MSCEWMRTPRHGRSSLPSLWSRCFCAVVAASKNAQPWAWASVSRRRARGRPLALPSCWTPRSAFVTGSPLATTASSRPGPSQRPAAVTASKQVAVVPPHASCPPSAKHLHKHLRKLLQQLGRPPHGADARHEPARRRGLPRGDHEHQRRLPRGDHEHQRSRAPLVSPQCALRVNV